MTESDAPEQMSPLVQREKDMNSFFAFILPLWPFSILGVVFLDGHPLNTRPPGPGAVAAAGRLWQTGRPIRRRVGSNRP